MEELIIKTIETEEPERIIDEAMQRYGQEILQLVFSYVKDRTVAEDLTQEIFIKCYKSLHTYKRTAKFRTWLWRIAINHCKDYLKSWYNRNVMTTEDELSKPWGQQGTIEQELIRKDEDQQLALAVMELPVNYREVIYLFYFEELPIKEIALMISAKENTVKTRLRRAKELLKEKLEG